MSFSSLLRSGGECLQHGEQLSPARLQPRAAAEIPQWHHHRGRAGAAHEQIRGRHQEERPSEGGLAKHCLWRVQNRGDSAVQDPGPAVERAEERWAHPAQRLLPRLGEDGHGRAQSHQVPRGGRWNPRVFGPSAFQCWCSSRPICQWQNRQALVSSGGWGWKRGLSSFSWFFFLNSIIASPFPLPLGWILDVELGWGGRCLISQHSRFFQDPELFWFPEEDGVVLELLWSGWGETKDQNHCWTDVPYYQN